MKDNRDMFYSDYQAGGFVNPFNNGNMFMNNNMMYDNNYMENRILKLERQIKHLESRVTRLENLSGNYIDNFSSSTDMYMI